MNKYESIIIIKPNLEEQEIESIITEITDLINQNGKVIAVDKKGTKMLAYEIKKNKQGYYITFDFEVKSEFVVELERHYRINENIIKFITVKHDED